MPEPRDLTASAVDVPGPVLHEATVLDDATEPGQEVRCVVPSFSEQLSEDPMPWMPYVTAAGVFYPKKGDRAVLGDPDAGPPVILAWWPDAAEPDVSF
jgi:hypothetical protein